MKTSVNTYRTIKSVLSIEQDEIDDFDIELWLTPCDWMDMHTKLVEDKLVVAYLVHDDCPPNPMTEYDGMGELITECCGVITDGNPAPHLGLEEMGYRYDISKDYELDGVYELAVEKLKPMVLDNEDFLEWCIENCVNAMERTDKRSFVSDCFDDIDFGRYGDCIPGWLETLWLRCQDAAWDELYEQGKLGTYLAIPVNYCDSNHGPGTASAGVTSLDNANAVWIPKQCDLDNLADSTLSYRELYKKAEAYAQSCLDEYIKWCNGDCYGCVVEVFQRNEDGSWEQIEEDSCWGFIGSDWAEEALKSEFFEPTLKRFSIMNDKDYNLLRPFDLDAAKRGEMVCWYGNAQTAKYLAGPDAHGMVAIEWAEENMRVQVGQLEVVNQVHLRMAPLCWVEGRPVYKGDVLFSSFFAGHSMDKGNKSGRFVVGGYDLSSDQLFRHDDKHFLTCVDSCTWTSPRVKCEGWIIADINTARRMTKERAEEIVGECTNLRAIRIEWEEPV